MKVTLLSVLFALSSSVFANTACTGIAYHGERETILYIYNQGKNMQLLGVGADMYLGLNAEGNFENKRFLVTINKKDKKNHKIIVHSASTKEVYSEFNKVKCEGADE